MKMERLKRVGSNLYTTTLKKVVAFQMSYGHCSGSGSVGHCNGDTTPTNTTVPPKSESGATWYIPKGATVDVHQEGNDYFVNEKSWLTIKTSKVINSNDAVNVDECEEDDRFLILEFPDKWKLKIYRSLLMIVF